MAFRQSCPRPVPEKVSIDMKTGAETRKNDVLLVGIDCAVDPRNVGVARATLREGTVKLQELHDRVDALQIASLVQQWRKETPIALFALDAPLGWPAPLGHALYAHSAGAPLAANAHALFRRKCDDVVAFALKKRPLDVGADRIARTAHAALGLLSEIRARNGIAIPMAWAPGLPAESMALEVYPGGTLKSLGLRSSGYKGAGREKEREEIYASLEPMLDFDEVLARKMRASDHMLDAAVCTLAAADFVREEMILPPDDEDVRREGWIWVRRPRSSETDVHVSEEI